jgi:hypothetical protein
VTATAISAADSPAIADSLDRRTRNMRPLPLSK